MSVSGGAGEPEAAVVINGELGYFKEDTANDVTLSASTADSTDELTSLTLSGLIGWALDGTDITALEALADVDSAVFAGGTLTITFVSGVENFNYTALTLTPPADTDTDTAVVLTANVQDKTDNSVTNTNVVNDTFVVDAILDDSIDVSSTQTDGTEAVGAQTLSLGLDGSAINPFTGSGNGGEDTDGSESGTLTLTLSSALVADASLSLAGGYTGSVIITDGGDADDTTFALSGWTNTADLAAAIDALQVTLPGGFDGDVTGNLAWSFADAGLGGTENDLTDNSDSGNTDFTVSVDSVPNHPVNDSIIVEEESIPGIGGNNENEGLNYTLSGTFADNADWGVDGFGGIVSVNGVTPSSDSITINNSNWMLTVNATTGSYTFTLLSNINSTPFADNLEGTNDLPIFNVIGQDGDGSQIGFGLEAGIVDDIPTIIATQPDDATYEFTITNHDNVSSAGYHNSYGYYIKDATGAPTTGVVVWDDVKDADTFPVTVSGFTPDQIGFFIIPNGENNNTGLDDNTPVTFKFVDGSGVEVPVGTSGGQWQAFSDAGSTALSGTGSHVFFDNADLNSDAQDHVVDNGLIGNQNWEDLLIPNGDGDFNDVNINVEWNLVTAAALTVDETELADDSELTTASATMNVAGSFDISPGADGLGSVAYVLGLVSQGVDSGLVDTLSKESVLLRTTVDGDVEGYVADDVVFTLNVEANGDVTLTQLRAVVHGNPEDYDEAVTAATIADGLIALTATVTDSDGDTAYDSIDVGALIAFEDDGPKSLNPTTSHLKDIATSPDVVQFLNFAAGADGVEAVVFDTSSQGLAATDALGNELTFNGTGEALFINFSEDGTQLQFVTKNDHGTLNTTDAPKFFIQLSADGQTYSVHSEGIINNDTAVTATDLTSIGGGNVVSKVISNLDGTTQDVVMTTATGKTINTNSHSIGIGTQNAITVDETIRFDFTNGDVSGHGGNTAYTYDGTHNLTRAFTQQIQKTTAGTDSANITVSAILADADNVFFGDTHGESPIGITSVKVYSGTLAEVQNGTATDQTSNVNINIEDGIATIDGLKEGWIYQVQTADDFSAIQVGVDAGNIKLGVFSYGLQSDGLPIELDYNIIGTDGDGDSITGSLDVNLYPAGATLEGDDLNNMLNGTNNTDYLLGRGGNDILFGNGGDDLLIGGYGDDEMTGGSGKDAFLFSLAANSGNDTIKDFEAGNDKLNFIDVLDLDGNSQFNLNDAINAISDSGASGDITISLNNGGSVTLQGIGTGAVNDIGALQTLLGASNITADES